MDLIHPSQKPDLQGSPGATYVHLGSARSHVGELKYLTTLVNISQNVSEVGKKGKLSFT